MINDRSRCRYCGLSLLFTRCLSRNLSGRTAYYVVCDNEHETYLSEQDLDVNPHIRGV